MKSIPRLLYVLPVIGLLLGALDAQAQNFHVQCPSSTPFHPLNTDGTPNGNIKCQQIAGGDGYATMGDGTTTYLFGFGPLSGLPDIYNGLPGTQANSVFNTSFGASSLPLWQPSHTYAVGAVVQTALGNFYKAIAVGVGGKSGIFSPTGTAIACDGKVTNNACAGVTWTFQPNGSSGDYGTPGTSVNNTLVGMPDGNFTFEGAIGLTEDYAVDPWASGLVYLKGATVRTPTGIYSAISDGTSGLTTPTGTTTVCDSGSNVAVCPAGVPGVPTIGVTWAYQSTLLDGHVDARSIMDVGVMNANQPAPLIAIDEDDELFLTLTNVGMIMRPDLFEQHTVHFHGYPNASAFYDGVPDASIAINVGGSFTYYYLAPDAGTYFWHCHIAPPEHLQMGMVGQLYVRPRQNKVPADGTTTLYSVLKGWETGFDPTNPTTVGYENVRKRCGGTTTTNGVTVPTDILCTTPLPTTTTAVRVTAPDTNHPNGGAKYNYAYNDGDGSTYYDVEYPIQIHGFDPNFHFVGMTFNPESFNDMKDKYFLLNGRSYPDTVGGYACTGSELAGSSTAAACAGKSVGDVVPGPMETQSTDGTNHASQPLPTVINIPAGGHALLRISDLDVSEYQTLASLGIPMRVVGLNARLLRDMAGNNMAYNTNSITLAGGESIDVILDACMARDANGVCLAGQSMTAGQKFFLYTPQLDHLSNDAENFGGLMTEVNICGSVDPTTKVCGT